MQIDKRISTIINAAEDKKAFDLTVLDIRGLSGVADYYVIASASSTRQAVAVGEEIEDQMSKEGHEPLNKNGYGTGTWVLLDYEDILVHVFQKDEREFYNLEKLWVDGKIVDLNKGGN